MNAEKNLKNLFKKMEKNQTPGWLEIMLGISSVTQLVTLDNRPPESSEPRTVCELNGRNCCRD